MTIYDCLDILKERPHEWWSVEEVTNEYNHRYGMKSSEDVIKACISRHTDKVAVKRVKKGLRVIRYFKVRQPFIPGANCQNCGNPMTYTYRTLCEECR